MKFVRVLKWWDFQHYDPAKRTPPPWIKVYNDLLDVLAHPKFSDLSDGAKLTLHHLRLLASTIPTTSKNEAPLIPEKWVNRDRLNMSGPPKIKELIAAGFAEIVHGIASSVAEDTASTDARQGASKQASKTPLARSSALLSESSSVSLEGDAGEPFFPPPDFAAVARCVAAGDGIGWRQGPPPEQVVVGWVQTYGADLLLETIEDKRAALHGKHYTYLETILSDRKRDPSERPGARRGGKASEPPAQTETPAMQRLDDIREAAHDMRVALGAGRRAVDPAAVEYLTWLAPNGTRMRDDALTFDEWKAQQVTA